MTYLPTEVAKMLFRLGCLTVLDGEVNKTYEVAKEAGILIKLGRHT